jgi:hypothetical protein
MTTPHDLNVCRHRRLTLALQVTLLPGDRAVIKDVALLRDVLLDWRVWDRAPVALWACVAENLVRGPPSC